jgi:tetratricopeptide (TPR) repeat protein
MTRIGVAAGVSAIVLSLCNIPPAQAAVTVIGGSAAQDCFQAAKYGGPPDAGIAACTRAIGFETLSDQDMAGTYVNRGVLYMSRAAYQPARSDFEQAIKLEPRMGEAIVNRGGALIAQRRYAEGISEITRGLELNPEEPEKAYFNRALAYESIDDLKAAYFDYSKALELKPNWEQPKAELARFTVSQR